jgi:ligand-binding sensor domain-containing protein/serine phosphatase RsbU (regulator of sigma subunit)
MRHFFAAVCSVLFLFFSAGNSFGQQYNIKLYGTKDGLVNSIVKTIFLDSKGYLWFGTQGGISRFDGKKFENFTDKNGLVGNDITCITEDKSGKIWIAAYGSGISYYDKGAFTNFNDSNGLSSKDIYSLACDDAGNMWIATYGGGIQKYDGKKFETFSTKTGLTCDHFFRVTRGNGGNLWFGTRGKGVYRYNGKNFINVTATDGLVASSYYTLFGDSKKRVWLGSVSRGIDLVESDFTIHHLPLPEVEGDLVTSIIEDRHNNVWIAGKRGLLKYNGRSKTMFTEAHGLSSNSISALCEDYDGNIWVGTASGLCMFKNEAIVIYTEKEGLQRKTVAAICREDDSTAYLGISGGGFAILRNNKIYPQTQIKELADQVVIAIHKDPKNRIWVGSDSNENGLVILTNKNGQLAADETGRRLSKKLPHTITQILTDRTGNMWLASFGGGVYRIDDAENITTFDENNGLPSNKVIAMYEDRKGRIWVGMVNEGLVMIENGKITRRITDKNGLGDNTVWSITENSKGQLFFGTGNNGVSCFADEKFTVINAADGLCSNLIYALITDSEDRLWIGTDKGVNRLSLGTDFKIKAIKYYGEKEGLRGLEISNHAFMLDKNRQLWMGTNAGLVRYDPLYDYVNDNPPLLQLSDLRLFYQHVDWSKIVQQVDPDTKLPVNPELSYKDNHLSFDFQALTTDNVRYQFMLEGLDDGWSPLTQTNSAVYTNIPAGKSYTFIVKAINSDGFESKETLRFSFAVRPPFWQTWWFYGLCTIAAIALVIIFIRWRTSRLEKEKQILAHKVDERTRELQVANLQLSVAYTDIKDSINYAKRIQEAILPLGSDMQKLLNNSFIFFRPRDVVSGDFYWVYPKKDLVYFAAVDCTGHGVPGAFMSLIGYSLLNEILNETGLTRPADILSELRERLIVVLKQSAVDSESKDGMDMVLCCLDKASLQLTFAGANNPLYHVRSQVLTEYKGDKQPIGVHGAAMKPFTHHELQLQPGDHVYMSSDGYPDQFGGPKGKKFMYTRFKEMVAEISVLPMEEQYKEMATRFDNWMTGNAQVDDVLVIGFRV